MHEFPTLQQVEAADQLQIVSWYRFLPTPRSEQEQEVVEQIMVRYHQMGTVPERVSKEVGWPFNRRRISF